MRVSELGPVVVLLAALLACKGTSDAPAPAATAGVVQPPKPSATTIPPEPKRQVLAMFDGEDLQECVEISPPPGKEEKFEKLAASMKELTRIGQRCSSLGHTTLGSCSINGEVLVQNYYAESLVASGMADCLKQGGAWTANTSPEADLAKAEQRLKKLRGSH